jgi:hypothetical protein
MNPFETMGYIGISGILLWFLHMYVNRGPRDRLIRATNQVWINELLYWDVHLPYHIDLLERGFHSEIYEDGELVQLNQILEEHKSGVDNKW